MFRSPLQRLAQRVHFAGESTRAPLSESGMEFAIYVNLGVAVAGLVALLLVGAAVWLSLTLALFSFLGLSVALFHPVARWLSVALGTSLVTALGVGVGGLVRPDRVGQVGGGACGLILTALFYGPLVVEAITAARKPPPRA